MAQPLLRLSEGIGGFDLDQAVGVDFLRQGQDARQVDVTRAQGLVVARRLGAAVVDVEVAQFFLVGQDKGDVAAAVGAGMADIPGEAETRALYEQFDGFFLEFKVAGGVFDRNHDVGIADPFLAAVAEGSERLHVVVKIAFVHLNDAVGQGHVDTVVHVHIQRQRLRRVSVGIDEGSQFFGRFNDAADGLQISAAHKGVEIGNVHVFIQMDGVINVGLFGSLQQRFGIFQSLQAILGEIRI